MSLVIFFFINYDFYSKNKVKDFLTKLDKVITA